MKVKRGSRGGTSFETELSGCDSLQVTDISSTFPVYRQTVEEVVSALGSDIQRGLTAVETKERLARFGPNELASEAAVPLWRRFAEQFRDVLVILLIIAAAISGGLWAWEFEERGKEIKVRVDGQVAFNNSFDIIDAAIDGFGLAYVPEEIALPYLSKGKLKRVLEKYCPVWDGYHLYYPSRRQSSPAFVAVVDTLRHRS